MLIKILVSTAVLIGGLLIYVGTIPTEMHISREVIVNAAPEKIFPYINNSSKANDWMPWSEVDPKVKMNYSGATEGVGSKSSWESTGDMGTGEALVVESNLNKNVKTQLTYTKPFKMTQLAEVSLSSVDGGTKIQWSVTGQNNFLCRLMGVFMNMDKMIGGQFEKGLTNLKNKVEVK